MASYSEGSERGALPFRRQLSERSFRLARPGARSVAKRLTIGCIYCRHKPPRATFYNSEHILNHAFGGFLGRTTLTNSEVCDRCNEYFGKTLDLMFARNTLEGFARYPLGIKTDRFDPPTADGKLHFLVAEGDYAGARLYHRMHEGRLVASPAPQVGIAAAMTGPYDWFELDQVPLAEVTRAKLPKGGVGVIRIEGFEDIAPVMERMRQLGYDFPGGPSPSTPLLNDHVRMRVSCLVGTDFGRALAKIGMNYVAAHFGAEMVLDRAFNAARKFIRRGKTCHAPQWWATKEPLITTPHERGHVVGAVHIGPQMIVEIGFAGVPARWNVILSSSVREGIGIAFPNGQRIPVAGAGAHFYDLDQHKVCDLETTAWHFPGKNIAYLNAENVDTFLRNLGLPPLERERKR